MKTIIIIAGIFFAGCTSSTGIIPDGRDSYRISYTGDTGFTNSNSLQRKAYGEATAFCADRGRIVETVNMESKQSKPLGGWPEASLIFKCVEREE